MGIRLSERMAAVAGMVTPGNRLADVGCDHAYIPIALCQAGRIPSAIAMDVKAGPLEIAKANIEACGWDDRIETRQSDGLKALGEDEADTVLIAGMGGLLTKRILSDRAIPESVSELVLQPQSEVPQVRECIRGLGFVIVDEDMVLEDEKFYPMMKARRGQAPDEEAGRQELEDAFGPVLLQKRHPVLYKWLERELKNTEDILAHLEREIAGAARADHLIRRRDELNRQRALLETAIACYGQEMKE